MWRTVRGRRRLTSCLVDCGTRFKERGVVLAWSCSKVFTSLEGLTPQVYRPLKCTALQG